MTEEMSWPGSEKNVFCVQTVVEIRKDPDYVKTILCKNMEDCPLWHPRVEAIDFQDPEKTSGVGSVRKLIFYGGAKPEYFLEECAYISPDYSKAVFFFQEENRPFILDYLGPVFEVEAIDDNNTRLTFTITYRPKGLPFTRLLATTVMKEQFSAVAYKIAHGIKYHCETGNVATNKVDYPKPYDLVWFKNMYELYSDSPENKLRDHMDGKLRYGAVSSIEIMKPMQDVKDVLFNLSSCPEWHPFVERTEFKGGNDFHTAGAVRLCKFYPELVGKRTPEYVWEEILDVSEDKLMSFIQEENRPSIVEYIGKVFKLEEVNDEVTRVIITHVFRPKFLPLSIPLATGPMKDKLSEESHMMCWCLKYHCETGKVGRYDMVPEKIRFFEAESVTKV